LPHDRRGGNHIYRDERCENAQNKIFKRVIFAPEYPSATAALCGAHAQVLRRFYGTDDLGFAVQVPRGSSIVEPGMTPATDMVLSYPTWTDFEQECGLSRFWGGVHFMPAVTEGQELGKQVGDGVYEFVRRRIDGGR
jgi:hypothetical protein